MTEFKDAAYKDSTPQATVTRIKSILQAYGIQTTENWQESHVPYCYAMSVQINGTTFKANGKGVTREFAQASGYGELMERLQLGMSGSSQLQKSDIQTIHTNKKCIPASELLHQNQLWYDALSEKLTACTGKNLSSNDILSRFTDKEGSIDVREYINAHTGTTESFPAEIIRRIYATNGCAAGNTIEEAMVQAISEIVERHHQLRILHEDLTPPDIPEREILRCKTACSSISFLQENGFDVLVKDCSLGAPFPVVCVCIIHKITGRYHTHFGAFPIFEIALERALTESFQGRTLENVAQFHDFSTKKNGQYDLQALGNELFFGSWKKSKNFFIGDPSYPYNHRMGFTGQDNKTLLRQCLDYFKNQGYDVLVRNHSALGFPTCQVLIPGYSEVMIHRLHPGLDDTRYAIAAANCLRRPAQASASDTMALMMHLQILDQFGPKIRNSRDFAACARIPMTPKANRRETLMVGTLCYLNYTMGRLSEVMKGIDKLIPLVDGNSLGHLICLRRYLALKSDGCSQEQIHSLLKVFHPEAVHWLTQCIEERHNPFSEFVLDCDQCKCAACPIEPDCCYLQNQALSTLIAKKTKELNKEAFLDYIKNL